MRVSQVSQYAERIERVVKHIEGLRSGDSPPSLEALAKVAAISPFHFHRVFRLMTGETVLDCIRRVSFARAMTAIRNEALTLEDAAEASGYASGQAFARSLKGFAGASAGELRADPAKMAAFEEKVMGPVRGADDETRAVEVRIVELAPLKILAMRNVGAYEELFNGYTRLFGTIADWAGPEVVTGIHGLWPDDPATSPPQVFRFDCAFAVSQGGDAPTGTRWEQAPDGPCLSAHHVGDYGGLLETIDGLYAAALKGGMELRDAPLFTHYLDDPEETPEAELRTEIYLPVT